MSFISLFFLLHEAQIISTSPNTPALATAKMPKRLILTLAAVFALTPFTIDSYLPAMTTMAAELQVDISMLSLTVSLYIFGLAFGQLLGGPLSDKRGRRFAMLTGLGVFAVASVLLTTAVNIELLWLWRFVQAIGGGIAIVGVPATIRDNCSGTEAAKLFSLIALIMMIAPSIAPSVGTLVLHLADWRWIFYLLAVFSGLVAILVIRFMPAHVLQELNDSEDKPKKLGLRSVFSQRRALGFMVAQAFAYSVMMTFLTNASMIYMQVFDVSAAQFSVLFAANIGGLIVANRLNTLLLRWFQPQHLLQGFLALQVTGGIVLVTSSLFSGGNLYLTVAGFVMAISANGGVMANASACFMRSYGHNAGSASAVLGAVQYTVGGTVSVISALVSQGQVLPVTLIMLTSGTIALTGAVYAAKHNQDD